MDKSLHMRIFILLVGLIAILSCSNDEVDSLPPMVEIVSLNPSPNSGVVCGSIDENLIRVLGGDTIIMELRIDDESEIGQYKIDIHHNFDCHGHGSNGLNLVAPEIDNSTEDWFQVSVMDWTEDTDRLTLRLPVPTQVTAGTYHLGFQISDVFGNTDGLGKIYSVNCLNPWDTIPPRLTFDSEQLMVHEITKADSIVITATLSDDEYFSQGGNGLVYAILRDKQSNNFFKTSLNMLLDQDQKEYEIRWSYHPSNTLSNGQYELLVILHDGVRNQFIAAPIEFTLL